MLRPQGNIILVCVNASSIFPLKIIEITHIPNNIVNKFDVKI